MRQKQLERHDAHHAGWRSIPATKPQYFPSRCGNSPRLHDGRKIYGTPLGERVRQVFMAVSDSEAIARAWVLAQPIVDSFISSAVRNHADAQDILQDVAVAILDHHSSPPLGGNFTAWTIGIARHKIADHFRRQTRLQLVMTEDVLQDVADAFSGQIDVWTAQGHALELCLDRVKGDAKHLLDLRYREGHSPQEIARRFGRTSEAVRASLLRVRRNLRECIERRLGQPQGLTPTGGD
jgi:RNA polymerase sigma-70 factor, ECF subfamily